MFVSVPNLRHFKVAKINAFEMDIDNSCDSDISESWSLIDLNDNEHGNEANSSILHNTNLNDNTPTVEVRNANSSNFICKSSRDNFLQQFEETEKNSANFENTENLNVLTVYEHTKDQQDFKILHKGKIFQDNYDLENKSSDVNNCGKTNVSEKEKIDLNNKFKDIDNDTDCISIISESECNEVKFSAYETDEIWEDKSHGDNMPIKSHPNALKRKRKKLKINCRESSEESISSDFMFPDEKYYGNFRNADAKRSTNEMQVKEYQTNPVYRHYRNNVANTMLTLAMGVIFAGVACIALGHFLGVHDAQQTAGEMMQTLKRLQMENILLQTRLTQLSRAFFNRKGNNLELKMNVESQNCLKKYFSDEKNIYGDSEDKLYKTAGTENSPFLQVGTLNILGESKNPVIETFISNAHALDSNKFVNYIRGQKNYLNLSKFDNELSKEPFSTTSLKPNEIQENFLISRKGMENAKKMLVNHNYKLSQKIDELFVDNNGYYSNKYLQHLNSNLYKQNCLAVRENDLSNFRWYLIKEKKEERKYKNENEEADKLNNSVMLYKFPQPEEYYLYEGTNQKLTDAEQKVLDRTANERLKQKVLSRDGYEVLSSVFKNGVKPYIDMLKLSNSTDNTNEKKIEDLKFKKNVGIEKQKKNIEAKKKRENIYSVNNEKLKDSVKTRENLNVKEAKAFNKFIKKFNKGLWKMMKKICKDNAAKKDNNEKECNSKNDCKLNFSTENGNRKDNEPSGGEYMNTNSRVNFAINDSFENFVKRHNSKSKRNSKKKDKVKKRECLHFFNGYSNVQFKKPKKNAMPDMKWINQTESANFIFGNNYGEWLYKWARGREESRRNQKVSNWQFYRARSRENLRRGDAMWQFSRASAREFIRNDDHKNYDRKNFKYSQM